MYLVMNNREIYLNNERLLVIAIYDYKGDC